MQKYVDDSKLADILKEATQVMEGIEGEKVMDRGELMEMARRIAKNTDSYLGIDSSPGTNFVERNARKVKSKIGKHMDILKTTASNISLIRERINRPSTGLPKPAFPEIHLNPESHQLGDYNRKIDETLKYLSTKTAGKTQIEQKIKKFRDIMGDVEGTLKDLPKAIKEGRGKVKKPKPIDQKLDDKLDQEAEEMLKEMQDMAPQGMSGWAMDRDDTDEENEGSGDCSKYEGFKSQQDLNKYKEIFKKFVGEYPEEYEKRNREEGHYDKDGIGRVIDKTKPGNPRRPGLYSPPNKEKEQEEAMKRCLEMEKNLRDVLSKSKGDGFELAGSVLSEKNFLDDYIEKKMDSLHTGDGFTVREEEENKIMNSQKKGTKKKNENKTAKDGKLCLDGPSSKGTAYASVGGKAPSSPAKANKKCFVLPKAFFIPSDEKKPEPSDEKMTLEDQRINWDMERIKKLIVKEKQEALRKKRDDWERNNEISEAILDREKVAELKKLYQTYDGAPAGRFDVPIPDSKPSPSDFITNRDRHEKLYRKATKGKEGIYHKEDLDYEFGVSPYYYDPPKNKKEGGDSKDTSVSIKSYRGVRKKSET